ncbi:MAG TPA: DUF4326 domain-containing protein [Rudaea sp.]|nr:DUF4326 domain-containing protein [Rudaea sp.]
MNPKRVQLSRAKGWRMPPNTVKVDRATRWGNPFVIGKDGTREECIALYRRHVAGKAATTRKDVLASRRLVAEQIGELKGKNLACWCPLDGPCHADVLLELANRV